MTRVFNRKKNKYLRRELRKKDILTERVLWEKLRNRRLYEYKFRRQHGVGNYIVDFYCAALKLVIEIDGATHSSEMEIAYDKRRQSYLENIGLKILRFNNSDIYKNIDSVFETIVLFIDEHKK